MDRKKFSTIKARLFKFFVDIVFFAFILADMVNNMLEERKMKHILLKSATVVGCALLFTGCAQSPDSSDTKKMLVDEANAQGGVCLNQTFSFMSGKRHNGFARVTNISDDVATLEVHTHRASKTFGFGRGDSAYSDDVKIKGFPVKKLADCTL